MSIERGFFANFTPSAIGDPNAGGIPIGSDITPISTTVGNPYVLANLAGHTLSLVFSDASISSFSVTSKVVAPQGVPEPGVVGLTALGLLGLYFVRRRRTAISY